VGFLLEYWRVERTDAAESQLATRDEAKLRGGDGRGRDPRRRLVLQRLPWERTGPPLAAAFGAAGGGDWCYCGDGRRGHALHRRLVLLRQR